MFIHQLSIIYHLSVHTSMYLSSNIYYPLTIIATFKKCYILFIVVLMHMYIWICSYNSMSMKVRVPPSEGLTSLLLPHGLQGSYLGCQALQHLPLAIELALSQQWKEAYWNISH